MEEGPGLQMSWGQIHALRLSFLVCKTKISTKTHQVPCSFPDEDAGARSRPVTGVGLSLRPPSEEEVGGRGGREERHAQRHTEACRGEEAAVITSSR